MEISKELIEFVHKTLMVDIGQLNGATSLEKDLGVTGSDAVDFMNVFFSTFNVFPNNFDASQYFYPEGFDPIGAIIRGSIAKLFGDTLKLAPKDITLTDLERSIVSGKWIDL